MAFIHGTNGPDRLEQSTGHDMIFGLGGNDFIDGKDWNDTIYGGSGNDTIIGGTGVDMLYGDDGNDAFIIDNTPDYYNYYRGDYIDGGFGDDTIFTRPTSNTSSYTINVGVIKDVEIFTNLSSTAIVSLQGQGEIDLSGIRDIIRGGGIGPIWGSDQNDFIKGFNDKDFGDNIWASSGNDTVYGMAGNDTIQGANGNDTLIGGLGNDLLGGGGGSDVFVFVKGEVGHDRIQDFQDGIDRIRIVGNNGPVDLSMLRIMDTPTGARIEIDNNTSVTLLNTSSSLIGAEDFIFA